MVRGGQEAAQVTVLRNHSTVQQLCQGEQIIDLYKTKQKGKKNSYKKKLQTNQITQAHDEQQKHLFKKNKNIYIYAW